MALGTALELTPQQVEEVKKSGAEISFIDVREPNEWAVAHIEGASLIPMGAVPANLQQLDSQAEEAALIVYCHHGVRSLQVVSWLRDKGVENCYSLAGGIDRWSREVDSNVPRY
jgi:rhodanese-related sulfurtransferase